MQTRMEKNRVCAKVLLLILGLAILTTGPAAAAQKNQVPDRAAIVLAAFGTSHPEGLAGILKIREDVREAFPHTPVRLAFTSNIIRRIWHSRRDDRDFLASYPGIPQEILYIKAPLATIADLVDEDYGHIVVQPTHIAAGEEFADLSSLIASLNSIKTLKARNMPFRSITLGRPALGAPGIDNPYRRDLERVAEAMAGDAETASREKCALVYLAHGNRHYPTGFFHELEHIMRKRYPDVRTYFTMATGFPDMEILEERLAADGVVSTLLVPFMTVAGDHVQNDMLGEKPGSLKSRLEARGIGASTIAAGLGERREFTAIFVENIRDAARDAGIELK